MDPLFLSHTPLFKGSTPEEIRTMLNCLGAEEKQFGRGDVIYCAGDLVGAMGVVLSGSVSIENDDVWGNKSILDKVGPGQVFAESYACVPGEPLMISVVAAERSKILFLNIKRLLQVCTHACGHHSELIRNLLLIASQKNLNLSRRIFHTSSKTIRGRLLSYLSFQSARQGSRSFDIPFNRQQLADYLSVDRSALSNELSKMQKEGMLRVERSHFTLLDMETEDVL